MNYKILIVDDNPDHLKAAELLLSSRGYCVETASTGDEALQKVRSNPWRYGLVILDYHLGKTEGTQIARSILASTNNLYIMVHSADTTQQAAIEAVDAGAVGFIPKSAGTNAFLDKVRTWCKKYEETYLTVSPPKEFSDNEKAVRGIGLVGASSALAVVARQVRKYSAVKETVLITGETGTGKERVARALHEVSPKLFFPVNCASFNGSAELMENELFGHVKGSYTGADAQSIGVFRQAAGGTVLLDEIYTLSLKAQYKLLRALREKTVRPVGSSVEYPINCRVIATAKPDIEEMTKKGDFLPDLFERINILRIHIPPLRERIDDTEPLVAHFCETYRKESGIEKRFLKSTVQYLKRFDWPRNVAQLENTVRRLCVNVDGNVIMPQHLDEEFFEERNTLPLGHKLDTIARQEILEVISRVSSRREASRILGIPEPTLRRKLKEYGIPDRFAATKPSVEPAKESVSV